MFDLLVFTQHPKAYGPRRLHEEAKSQGVTPQVLSYTSLQSQGVTLLSRLPKAKCVILREPDYKKDLYKLRDEILNFYISKKVKVLNSESYLKWSVLDKITQYQEFNKANIPHIKLLNLSEAKYPYIVKNKLGSHGDSVYKIEGSEDLEKVFAKHKKEDLLFQEFQTSGFDLRVIVLNKKVLGIMKRTPKKGEFLSNYSQGGAVEKFESSAEIEKNSIQTAKHFKLDYVGVDLMLGNDNEWKVLEVNRACQFKGFEKATGVNVAKEIINFLNCKVSPCNSNVVRFR